MATAQGVSAATVQPATLGRAGLKPHVTRSFKFSNNPQFTEKLTDVVGSTWWERPFALAPPRRGNSNQRRNG